MYAIEQIGNSNLKMYDIEDNFAYFGDDKVINNTGRVYGSTPDDSVLYV